MSQSPRSHSRKFLAAPDREGRDQHHAAAGPRGMEHAAQLGHGVVARAVHAVAVGALEHHQVGLGHRAGVAQDRRAARADVAGEHQLARGPVLVGPQLDDRRADDVAGIAQAYAHPGQDLALGVVAQRPELAQDALHVVELVQRFQRRLAASLAIAVLALEVGGRQARRVLEHDARQVGGRVVGVDRPAVAAPRQQRQAADVVDVRVREHQRVDRGEVEGKLVGVARVLVAPALHHAAIEQDAPARCMHQVARAGNLARGPEELDPHACLLVAGRTCRRD